MEISINYVAVIVAVVANFIFGFLWYTPLFGKVWAKEMGMDPNASPDKGAMMKGMVIMVVGNLLLAYVLAHNIAAWGIVMPDAEKMNLILSTAFFTWLGFFVPQDLGAVAWEQKSWKLFFINTSYHLLSLILVAAILIFMW